MNFLETEQTPYRVRPFVALKTSISSHLGLNEKELQLVIAKGFPYSTREELNFETDAPNDAELKGCCSNTEHIRTVLQESGFTQNPTREFKEKVLPDIAILDIGLWTKKKTTSR